MSGSHVILADSSSRAEIIKKKEALRKSCDSQYMVREIPTHSGHLASTSSVENKSSLVQLGRQAKAGITGFDVTKSQRMARPREPNLDLPVTGLDVRKKFAAKPVNRSAFFSPQNHKRSHMPLLDSRQLNLRTSSKHSDQDLRSLPATTVPDLEARLKVGEPIGLATRRRIMARVDDLT